MCLLPVYTHLQVPPCTAYRMPSPSVCEFEGPIIIVVKGVWRPVLRYLCIFWIQGFPHTPLCIHNCNRIMNSVVHTNCGWSFLDFNLFGLAEKYTEMTRFGCNEWCYGPWLKKDGHVQQSCYCLTNVRFFSFSFNLSWISKAAVVWLERQPRERCCTEWSADWAIE